MEKYVLYQNVICPFSRKIRFLLDEIGIKYKKVDVKIWDNDPEFVALNPLNETPVLGDLTNNNIICDSFIIARYINKKELNTDLITRNFSEDLFGKTLEEKIEIDRLEMLFDKYFFTNITSILIQEIFYKTFALNNLPSTNINKLEDIRRNLNINIQYIEFLLQERKWLAGEKFSMADISASTQLSVLDYLGYINWKKNQKLKEWYIVIKSKKGFESILNDKIPGFNYSQYYNKLDF